MSIRPDLPLGKFARAQALERLRGVARELRRVRGIASPDAVHDLRVSIRRFSSVLQVLPECFSPKRARKGRKRLKRILQAAGEVRDRDIAMTLAAHAGNDSSEDARAQLAAERCDAARRLRREVAKDRARKALEVAKSAVRLPKQAARPAPHSSLWRPDAPADENAVQQLPTLVRDLFEAGRQALKEPVDPAALHLLRLKTKRRRYTLELFAPCYGPDLAERLHQLKSLQDRLGEINDCSASKDLAGDEPLRVYLDSQRGRLIADFQRYWYDVFDAPGECEGWMLELARRSSTGIAAAGRCEDALPSRNRAAAADVV